MRVAATIFALIFLFGCSAKMLRFEQYSILMEVPVAPDSSVYVGDDEYFQGIIWLNPVLKAENAGITSVKMIRNFGNYYVCAEGFKSVWMIEPVNDGLNGSYQPIDITPDTPDDVMKNISFSRYGQKDNTCVKFRSGQMEVFIDKKGNVNEKCN